MPPEEGQKFLEAQLTDDGFGFPGMEEKFRRSLSLNEVYREDQLPPVALPLPNARRKTQPKASTLKPLVLSNDSVASTAAAAPHDGVVPVDAMGWRQKKALRPCSACWGFPPWAKQSRHS